MRLTKKELKQISSLNGYIYMYGIVNAKGLNYQYINKWDKRFQEVIKNGKDVLFFKSSGTGKLLITSVNILSLPIDRKKAERKNIDILYSYLRIAQKASDNAKDLYDNSYYNIKQEYIIKAIKRAKKIGINVYYDNVENCVYFELSKGQVSFHTKYIDIDFLFDNCIVEKHKWSGLHDSRYIIQEYFNAN